MTKKLITEELINERLEAIGFGERQADKKDATMESVLDHYNVEIHDTWRPADFHIYEEQTADGYEVYIATDDMNTTVNVCENVYYYDSDLANVLVKNIKYSNGDEDYPYIIYISDTEAWYVDRAFQVLFEYLVERFTQDVIDILIDEGYEE
jgi:hypothetical protein